MSVGVEQGSSGRLPWGSIYFCDIEGFVGSLNILQGRSCFYNAVSQRFIMDTIQTVNYPFCFRHYCFLFVVQPHIGYLTSVRCKYEHTQNKRLKNKASHQKTWKVSLVSKAGFGGEKRILHWIFVVDILVKGLQVLVQVLKFYNAVNYLTD